jgi:hypothetical protein
MINTYAAYEYRTFGFKTPASAHARALKYTNKSTLQRSSRGLSR